MSLKRKTLLIAGSAFIILFLTELGMARTLLLDNYSKLEENVARQNVVRALNALSDDMANLATTASDWSAWDDTYNFIEDRNDVYIRSNLLDSTFTGLHLNAIIFVNTSGKIVFEKAFDLINNKPVPVPSSLVEHLSEDSPLLQHRDSNRGKTGILILPEGTLLLASQPILPSDDEGPIRGTLIMGRYLDDGQVDRLAERTNLAVEMTLIDAPGISSAAYEIRTTPPEERNIQVQTISEHEIAGYGVLEDIYGQPALILKINMSREIYRQGLYNILFFGGALLAAGLVLGTTSIIILNKLVLSRVSSLGRDVNGIGATNNRAKRVQVSGKDEISFLAAEINGMLEAIEQTEKALKQSEERYRAINEITVAAINSNDLGEMLDLLADRMSELIGADSCYLTLWDEQSSVVRLASASRPYAQQYKDLQIEPGEASITAAMLETGHELVAEDVSNSPYISPRIARLFQVRSLLGVPLIADDQKLGAVLLAFNQPHRFTRSEIDLSKQASRQVALSVLKMNLLRKSQQRAQEAETLRLSGATVASTLDPEEAIKRILDQLERVVPYDSASVQLLEDGFLEIRAGRGWPEPDSVVGLRFPIPGDNPNTVVITQQKPYILGDAEEVYSTFRSEPHAHIRSWLGVPLKIHDQVIGMLAVDKTQPHFYKSNHIDLVTAFADQVSISLENARLYAEERRRAKELDALQATVADITGELDMPSLLHAIVERAIRLLSGTSGGLYLCDHEKQELRCVTSIHTTRDFSGVVLKFGEGASGIVAQTGQPLVIGDYRVWEGRAQVYEKDQPFRSVLSAPLVWRDEVIGVIHILHDSEPHRFKQADLTLLTLFANQAAIALHNAQLYTDAQQRGCRKALLNEIIQVAISAPDLDAMLHSIVDHLGELFEADGACITLWDEEHETTMLAAANGPFREAYTAIQFMNGEATMTSAVLKTCCVLVAEDVNHSEYISPRVAAMLPTHSMIGLPLISDGHKLGAALIGCNQPRKFTQKDITLGEEVSAQIALAMSKMRLLEVEKRRADELDALRATVADISSELELEILLNKILERATTLLNATGGDLGLYEEDLNEIRIVVSHNMGKDYTSTRMAWGEGAMGRAIETNLPLVIPDYQQWEGRSPQYQDVPYHAVVAVPLHIRGRTIGALGIVDGRPKRVFSSGDQRLLYLFAQQAAIAIENAQLFDEIERQSITDMLTSLYNRRGLSEFGQRELDRASRFWRPFSVILLDIDKFKQINDKYGHVLGDHVLVSLAKRLQSELRKIDILGRYGGEEFVILLPETDEHSAYLVAERLRKSVEKTPFETARGAITITISLGVTCQREVKQELASLIDQADTAMYRAKRRGRNRTCIFERA
jgi:diguanylate cyclase (GGDEF)-like protein